MTAELHIRDYSDSDIDRCREIFDGLKAWFGIPSVVEAYLAGLATQPTFVVEVDGKVGGFVGLKVHTPSAAEVWVLAVDPTYHRGGLGRVLIERAEQWCRESGRRFLQVKTLSPDRDDASYAKTRRFYEAIGFAPLETFPELWDPSNPALQLVKTIEPSDADALIRELELVPHPEGGFFRETWRSSRQLDLDDYEGPRAAGTSILYLLRTEDESAWHRVASDELWFWQGGDELTLSLRIDGEVSDVVLGPARPQALVPAGIWQSARPRVGRRGYVLCGCVVVPGFDFADFEME